MSPSGSVQQRSLALKVPGWALVGTAVVTGSLALLGTSVGAPVQDAIEQRAAVVIEADFAKPLDNWFGNGDWTRAWLHEPTAVRVGRLMLHRSSMRLRDYDLEFAGQIARQSLTWVFRASDLRNYYSAKLIAPAGPRKPMILERSVVINGEPASRVEIPIREGFDIEKPMRIGVQASGSDFRIFIDGRLVDFFRDDLLPQGGVGFAGEPDDRPRIYWMRVRHHDDMLGRVCAWLSPSVS